MRGEVYIINGDTIFVMGGCYSIDKYHQVEGVMVVTGNVEMEEGR